jgi:hypothetical protein
MCWACDNRDDGGRVLASPQRLAAARAVEAAMPGERVPDEAWNIFFGLAGGGLAWADRQRMVMAFERSEKTVRRRTGIAAGTGNAERSPFCCDPV